MEQIIIFADIGYVIGAVSTAIVIFVIIAAMFGDGDSWPYDSEKYKWYGHMWCSKCDYEWLSRRATQPRKCPNCRNTYITMKYGRRGEFFDSQIPTDRA